MRRIYRLTILVLLLVAAAGCAKQLDPIAFVAEKDGKKVCLFGSIHVADNSFYPLPDKIEAAYDEADALAVEADIRKVDQGEITRFIFEKGLYPAGESLESALGEDFETFRAYCEKNDISWHQFNSMRPWLASISLAQAAFQKLNLDPTKGIDLYFMNRDPEKPVLELESISAQFQYLSGFDEETQIVFLLETLEDDSTSADGLKELVRLWKEGNETGLAEFMFKNRTEKPRLEPFFELMFDKRNNDMSDAIIRLTGDNGIANLFVVVGAGHLVGEKSVPALLEKEGYTVTRL